MNATRKIAGLVGAASSAMPMLAYAQDAADARATEFRAMTGPAQESVPGGMLLVAAYAAIWIFIFAYVWRTAKLQSQTRAELALLSTKIDALHGGKSA